MSEKPIIFSTPMVQTILAGRKTQTRRPIKPKHNPRTLVSFQFLVEHEVKCLCKPPYQPGDVLWVRETWSKVSKWTDIDPDTGIVDGFIYKADWNSFEHPKWHPSIHMPRAAARIFLRVTDVRVERVQEISEADAQAEGIKSFWLTKEGGERADDWHESNGTFVGAINHLSPFHSTRREAYQQLWGSLYAKKEGCSWSGNPWVWVISFERVGA